MKRYIIILLHIGFWLCYFLLIIVILAVFFGNKKNVGVSQIIDTFEILLYFALIPSVFSFYGYNLIFVKYVLKKKYVKGIIICLIISLVSGNIGYIVLFFLNGKECAINSNADLYFGITLFISFIATISGTVALVIQGFITWISEFKLKEDLLIKNNEMELALIKSQLDPHFLFNTINNIDILIIKNATEASNYLNKLSDIMRFMLYETKADRILLSKELMYIEKYIELQKIRSSNTSFITLSIIGQPSNLYIAPMIFIPFIENAFKHTTNKKIKNAIIISITIEDEKITFVCSNKFNHDSNLPSEYKGLGNELIKKRLKLIYKINFKLEFEIVEDVYCVILTVPTHE